MRQIAPPDLSCTHGIIVVVIVILLLLEVLVLGGVPEAHRQLGVHLGSRVTYSPLGLYWLTSETLREKALALEIRTLTFMYRASHNSGHLNKI